MRDTFPTGLESRYRIVEKLGAGGYGEIFRAFWLQTGTEVALKVLRSVVDTDVDRQRFRREAEVAKRLSDAHSVRVLDFGQDQGMPAYISFELLSGRALNHVLAEGALTEARAVGLGVQIASSLSEAHLAGIVHRDIKPANIMYDPATDSVKVTDFGIARITDSSKTKTGMVLGTPSFMSPEQLAGRKIDGQSDIFSLGVTMYQLACGSLPFQGETMTQLMYKIANEPPVDILSINPGLPDCFAEIINRALAKTKEERFATGEEMAAAIRACSGSFADVDMSL